MTTLALLFLAASQTYSLPPGLIQAVCFVESSHNPKAYVHSDGNGTPSHGLCQVKTTTCNLVGVKGNLMDPKINIDCAAKYLKHQYDRYGNWPRAITAYNKGSSTSHGGSEYLAKVMHAYFKSL